VQVREGVSAWLCECAVATLGEDPFEECHVELVGGLLKGRERGREWVKRGVRQRCERIVWGVSRGIETGAGCDSRTMWAAATGVYCSSTTVRYR
jgi:hypothetical protein